MSYFTNDFLDFFKELAANNNKDWFDENRKRYEKSVREPFKSFVTDLIDQLKTHDSSIDMEAKNAIFRINRDIRFSKDKSPYKLHASAAISPGGRKAMDSPGIYVQLDPEYFSIYSGIYQTDKNGLYAIREKIHEEPKRFEQLISDAKFKAVFGGIHGDKNKVIPKEFKPTGEQQPLIYNKSFYYYKQLPPETIMSDDLIEQIIENYQIAQPLNQFFTEAMKKAKS